MHVRHGHEPRGDSRPRLSGGAKLRILSLTGNTGRALLDWTSEGGCPRVIVVVHAANSLGRAHHRL